VYISTGALELLDEHALAAVIAHERHHVMRRDPLRLACGRALLAGLFFIPALRRMLERQQVLAEIGADEAALSADGVDRAALASAMLSFSDASRSPNVGVDARRVDQLLGEGSPMRFPFALCIASAAALLLISACALVAGQLASGTATLAPPCLSGQPCIAVLAMIPAATGCAALLCARLWRARRA
jgi:Peptidase family M48